MRNALARHTLTIISMQSSLSNFKKPWYIWPLLIGVIIRFVVMPTTLHPDLFGHSFSAYFFAYEGKINLYDTLAQLPKDHPLVKNFGVADIFIYPPLTYYTLGIFRVITSPVTDPNFVPWLWNNLDKIHQNPALFRHLFWYKLPYLPFDIGVAFMIAAFFTDKRRKLLAFSLWFLNPIAIYVTFMIGQLDLLPVFFTVLSALLLVKNKPYWSLFAIGIAASYKMYPLFLVIPFALVASTKLFDRIKLIIAGLAPFAFFLAPYLGSSAFRSMVFSPKSQKMLYMSWGVSGAEFVYPFILGLIFYYFYLYYRTKPLSAWTVPLPVLIILFSVTHFHPQWFLWIVPFLVLSIVADYRKYWLPVTVISLCWLVITLFFEPSLSYGLFNPLWPSLENAIPLEKLLQPYVNVFQFKSLVRSVLAGAGMYYIHLLLTSKNGLKS